MMWIYYLCMLMFMWKFRGYDTVNISWVGVPIMLILAYVTGHQPLLVAIIFITLFYILRYYER